MPPNRAPSIKAGFPEMDDDLADPGIAAIALAVIIFPFIFAVMITIAYSDISFFISSRIAIGHDGNWSVPRQGSVEDKKAEIVREENDITKK